MTTVHDFTTPSTSVFFPRGLERWVLIFHSVLEVVPIHRGVVNLDFQGRSAPEIKFYPKHIFSRKMSFSMYDLGCHVGPSGLGLATPLPIRLARCDAASLNAVTTFALFVKNNWLCFYSHSKGSQLANYQHFMDHNCCCCCCH